MLHRFVLILLLLCLPAFQAESRRTSKTVQKEKREANRRIEQTRGKIKNNLAETRRQLARFETLEAEIKNSDTEIRALSKRTDSIGAKATRLGDSIRTTESRIATLQSAYGDALRTIRRQRQTASSTAFIFSAGSFTKARKRMRYLEELGKWQKEKASALKDAAALLERQKAGLDSVRAILNADLAELQRKKKKLVTDRSEADVLVGKLKRQGKRLEQVLKEEQEKASRLDRELDRIIEEEARAAKLAEEKRKAQEEARRKQKQQSQKTKPADTPKVNKPKPAPAPVRPVTVTSFAKAKGMLPMPVDGPAMIVSRFGRHTHKDFAKVEVQNNGIDIETVPGASAVAVYPGVVSMVIVMDGFQNVVLVRHGEYLTVYAGITDLAVRKGQEVSAGQRLGKVYTDAAAAGRSRLHFEVRKEKEKLNPEEWLR
ncbi:MAG: peptidoglycan DD-metalloendopeptidase family protein [Muribaculaceae bacterium]|nr:peptidoglycan DD-metalloendopeptidase family protein [Muribaculaceae bacterium]